MEKKRKVKDQNIFLVNFLVFLTQKFIFVEIFFIRISRKKDPKTRILKLPIDSRSEDGILPHTAQKP